MLDEVLHLFFEGVDCGRDRLARVRVEVYIFLVTLGGYFIVFFVLIGFSGLPFEFKFAFRVVS